MIVGAAGERDPPACAGAIPWRSASVASRPGSTAAASLQASSFDSLRPRAVASLPHPEQQHHPLDVSDRQRRAHPVERMRERVGEAALAEERDELVHRRPVRLEVAVILLGQVPDEHVQRDVVLREAGRHLDREERVRLVRDPQRALERVVVADRDERHAARAAGR